MKNDQMSYMNRSMQYDRRPSYPPMVQMVDKAPYDKYPVGMCYVPWQTWGEVYDCNEALYCGTIFPELNLPFMGSNVRKGHYNG